MLGDRDEAIDWYSKGLTELEKAVAMTVNTSSMFNMMREYTNITTYVIKPAHSLIIH